MTHMDDGPARGRPRRRETDEAVVAATLDVLRESGYPGLSIEAVAARAGVSRPTVYRRWPTKQRLVVHALSDQIPPLVPPDTGDPLADLRVMLTELTSRLIGSGLGRIVVAVHTEAGGDPELFTHLRELYLGARLEPYADVLRRGAARGRIRPDVRPELARDLLVGPLFYHWIVEGEVTEEYLDQLLDVVGAVLRP